MTGPSFMYNTQDGEDIPYYDGSKYSPMSDLYRLIANPRCFKVYANETDEADAWADTANIELRALFIINCWRRQLTSFDSLL